MIKTIFFVLAVLMFFPSANLQAEPEARGVWVRVWDFTDEAKIQQAVDKAYEYNFNQIYAHIRYRGDAYYYKGEYEKARGYDKAIADCTEAIRFKPDYAEAYCCRGSVYSFQGEYDKAIADFTKAIQLKPDYAEAYHYRCVSYYHKNDYDKARADSAKAKELGFEPD